MPPETRDQATISYFLSQIETEMKAISEMLKKVVHVLACVIVLYCHF